MDQLYYDLSITCTNFEPMELDFEMELFETHSKLEMNKQAIALEISDPYDEFQYDAWVDCNLELYEN